MLKHTALLVAGLFAIGTAIALWCGTNQPEPKTALAAALDDKSKDGPAAKDAPAATPAAPAKAEGTEKPAQAAQTTQAAAKKYPDQDPAKGWLEGRITLEGKVPDVKPLEIPASHQDHAFCSMHLKPEKLILSDKKEVKDVVVSVAKYKPAEKVKPRECTLENKNCAFVPHVQATTVGSTLKILSSDKFLHNTHGLLALGFFNNAVGSGQTVEKTIRKAGWGLVQCDLHSWMQGHIWIFEHDLFDVTGEDGAYKIANIPPGEYEIEIWHEYPLARQTQKVKVEAGKAAKLDVALKAVEVKPEAK